MELDRHKFIDCLIVWETWIDYSVVPYCSTAFYNKRSLITLNQRNHER